MSIYLRRLENEHADMQRLEEESSLISFVPTGSPPTRYDVTLSCTGIVALQGDGGPLVANRHRFQLILGEEFPYIAPTVRWVTPVFHPNFLRPDVCLGDFWYAGCSLAEMCMTLCEMVQYKAFNIYDPLDHHAARWLEAALDAYPDLFPIDNSIIRDLTFGAIIPQRREEA